MLLKPCIECGTLSDKARCAKHRPKDTRNARRRGYDTAWTRLSKRARAKQPFCTDCGATEDLQADHSPQAWERHAQGLPIRLEDVDVVCGPCNRARGAARTANRFAMPEEPQSSSVHRERCSSSSSGCKP